MAFPFAWMLITSFKTLGQVLKDPLAIVPDLRLASDAPPPLRA